MSERNNPRVLTSLLYGGLDALVDIPCKHGVCAINVKPRTNVSAKLVPPFRIVASHPIFSPINCNRLKEVCTQFDDEVIALTGTFGRFNVRNITFDCYPKGLSTLEVLRKGESVPKASGKHAALSPHYIRVNEKGQLEGSPQIVVSCHYSGMYEFKHENLEDNEALLRNDTHFPLEYIHYTWNVAMVLIPYLTTGESRVDRVMQTPTNGVCPPNIVCHRKVQRFDPSGILD
ncbi:hypothetical protein EGR_04598 [Echinococcus granulosus]|uniref:Uncharacterized protein n=1 Tax=Echinococcus granulosus TaxID=6210 RepID=W6V3H2_ECHGR|nr:hypothetical protein EGR_04598 [Echinococcus granulosus]EUB60579.1 hypothetical protein EGR_04598 [Echinococcus granulosus]